MEILYKVEGGIDVRSGMDVWPLETKTQEEGWASDETQHQLLKMLPEPTSFTSGKQQVAVSPDIRVASARWGPALAGPEHM